MVMLLKIFASIIPICLSLTPTDHPSSLRLNSVLMTSTNFTLLSVTATTPIRTDARPRITEPEVTVPENEEEGGEFETTSSTTTANEITTKEPVATTGAG